MGCSKIGFPNEASQAHLHRPHAGLTPSVVAALMIQKKIVTSGTLLSEWGAVRILCIAMSLSSQVDLEFSAPNLVGQA
jgi:hypothetical protein